MNTKPPANNLRIVAAAVRTDAGLIFSLPAPARHHHVLHAMCDMGIDAIEHGHPDNQGFLTNQGTYLGRIGAKACANDAGQIVRECAPGSPELFSEDLW